MKYITSLMLACAMTVAHAEPMEGVNNGPGQGGPGGLDVIPATDTIIDLSFFDQDMLVSSDIVDCELQSESGNNVLTKCYELTFRNYHTSSGPGCPESTSDLGGFGSYDGPTGAGFQLMESTLWDNMESDGYNIVKPNGNIRIQNPSGSANLRSTSTSNARTTAYAYCLDASISSTIQTTYLIPIDPDVVRRTDDTNYVASVEAIGVSLDGQKIAGEPPSVVANSGNIPALDWCGGHPDPSEYYHWHFVSNSMNTLLDDLGINAAARCTDIAQDDNKMFGYAADGYPMYGETDNDVRPTDLDTCGGHYGTTPEYPEGIYHYHALPNTAVNLPRCLVGLSPNEQHRFSFAEPISSANSDLEELTLSVYPNPTTDGMIYIENAFDELEIFDIEGTSVYKLINESIAEVESLDLTHLKAGIYFLQVYEGNAYGFQKIMIK